MLNFTPLLRSTFNILYHCHLPNHTPNSTPIPSTTSLKCTTDYTNRSTQQQAQYLNNEHAGSKVRGDVDGRSEFDSTHVWGVAETASVRWVIPNMNAGLATTGPRDHRARKSQADKIWGEMNTSKAAPPTQQ
ncbi:hypothetical protein PAXINDRAFT_16831 [Paxillus involutus ATCC 200175]|uniref:Uncharacterized protein n=1 Tax=Paxillus involutus ATCC 200175 TaxID=664439 RepID=A0A0C9T3F5_PAXIN|nr:hypothetical protein PAXINDRAFT_16831 [Paxillus involutus ATCC 200175]